MSLMSREDLLLPLMGSRAASGLARTFITEKLDKWHLNHLKDDALLVASELISNAAEAAPGHPLRLHLARDGEGLLVQVWDPSPEHPRLSATGPPTLADIDAAPETAWDDGGGWGLPLIQSLSAACGFRPTPPVGKWVWSRLAP